MKRTGLSILGAAGLALCLARCSGGGGGGDASTDGGRDSGGDARTDSGGDAGTDSGGDAGTDSGGDAGTDSGPTPCVETRCQAHLRLCGNCLDDDGDGLVDSEDPDCLGPCDSNEAGYFLDIPGGDSAPCALDCYFDQDEGSGNDGCEWDHRCDPLEPDPNPLCAYRSPPPPQASCPSPQPEQCLEVCGPLIPNGCDCFGCCELPAGSGRYVFIGSVDRSGAPTCTLEVAADDAACHPCTPVASCLNDCGRCELCLGRTVDDLPPDCFPGSGGDGGVDGGPGGEQCPEGIQPCGLPGQDPCPDGYYCITGCCQIFG